MARILIVDDDPVQRRLLEGALKRLGHDGVCEADGDAALARLAAPAGPPFDLMILDLVMPGLDGMGVLDRLRRDGCDVPVIVATAKGGIDTAVAAVRAGAVDFVVKPVGPERLQVSVDTALRLKTLEGEVARARRRAEHRLAIADIPTRSPAMAAALRLAERAAGSTIPVLVEGESGVGKEIVARAIHGSSPRARKPFVAVNCGALPANLVESILFGHERGAFTGASDKHSGKFLEAHGGTLFLDEIGELPLDTQVKLLRAIQEGEIDPVGGRRPVPVDFRLISATNRDLAELVREGRFREDLYYRLNVLPVRVPPLRERREDIAPLARLFLARFAAEEGRRVSRIQDAALHLLAGYGWPGNVRQLENAVFRAVVLAESGELTPADFPQIAGGGENAPASPIEVAEPEPARLGPAVAAVDAVGEIRPLEEVETALIRMAIDRYDGRMSEVARRLGIGRSTLYRRIKELGLEETAGRVLDDTATPEQIR